MLRQAGAGNSFAACMCGGMGRDLPAGRGFPGGREPKAGRAGGGEDEKKTLGSKILRAPSGVCADTVGFQPRARRVESFEAEAGRRAEVALRR